MQLVRATIISAFFSAFIWFLGGQFLTTG